MPPLDQIDQWLEGTGPWLLPLLGLASFVEYVFPPFPGDTVTLVGILAAVRGSVSPVWLLVAISIGSFFGSVIDYMFGVWLQSRVHSGRARRGRILSQERLHGLERSYRKWGLWLILANRFVPVARAVFFVFAGMSGLNFWRTVLVGLAGACLWNAMLIGAGYAVGANLEALEQFAQRMGIAGMAVALLAIALAVLGFAWRRRRARSKRST